MDELDRIFSENKDSFDRLEPRSNGWQSVQQGMAQPEPQPSMWGNWIKVAAVIILLLSIPAISYLTSEPTDEFASISLYSPQGEEIPLDPSMNKYTLVQFWASGNVLCAEENCYYYLPAYEKYADEGFEIYAISLDEDKQQWLQGIAENDLPWIHVSDLQGWASPLCVECNITKVPTSILLDQQGNIVARDLEAEELDETLGRLLAAN